LTANPIIQFLPTYTSTASQVSLLRLDQLHSIVSGNKWYKLRFYIQDALEKKAKIIASFGGPYSNHLVALAYAAKENNFKSIGYVRANINEPLTPSLEDAMQYGMHLEFIGRTHFQSIKNKLIETNKEDTFSALYFIDEGGYGILGAQGASTILSSQATSQFDYIIAAVGTGTMLAGIINSASPKQKIIGIPILKNEISLDAEINALVINKDANWKLLHQFHQGGYAKINPALIEFMNALWTHEKVPTDMVYTGKLLFAVKALIKENYFEANSKVLVLHSGGLQGNRSLPNGTLLF
jgi:1-aminocyclopropane-1-carboxylate deaminase